MQDFIPIQIDKSHLSTIGERLYSQSLDLIRELVANAYDADTTVVKIKADEASITVEDNGVGMNRVGLEQYLTIGSNFKKQNPLSPIFKRIRIGEFGISKFAENNKIKSEVISTALQGNQSRQRTEQGDRDELKEALKKIEGKPRAKFVSFNSSYQPGDY